ncbi:carbon starvation CstA family protein [Dermatophilus congolensis]|uniref:Carbon starvation protein A n=1 Tax=Dermatophilus congolensis TaxID=1863 RepID=A0A239V9H8_9MICO|nr:carbon starvation CstA family protein [Dermatophilus congolensis]MBO3130533.1 carbon starvation protein A [Dermatophilus congolensis]MBO3130837.1 carbon starvation protein A [Dermatophilus congolensis]MBO3135005.1 carbon starvation protein A [Dermatophilus congolensis]MBO3137244.1 carbon starvation protein A [Dermatophilus congolensis]MBO3139489.1 carbon starvation protein A [Dermatophilus congolensis]
MSTSQSENAGVLAPETDPPPVEVDPAAREAHERAWPVKKIAAWAMVSLLGGVAWVMLAFVRGETVNAIWFVFASLCTYAIAYRFYAKYIEDKLLRPDDSRATPAEYAADGKDFVRTDRRVLFGHHFAAIAGAGPLVGPILAAQMGYLPSTIWIIVGVILAGAVQDYLVLFFSMRRGGRSIGQMAKDELGPIGGAAALLATLAIMLIIIAILALVVVNSLGDSPWGVFSVGMTIPIALFMGVYMRYLRPGKVGEVSLIGVVLLLASIIAGGWINANPGLAEIFHISRGTLAWAVIIYGFVAAVLPVWILLTPRDYLSTFMKIGTIALLAIGIVVVRPEIATPAFSELAFRDNGPVFSGSLFPFLFVTIACGALSGFHATIASGTTPKLLEKERQARMVGYGGMLAESFVAIMALVCAVSIDRGLYFAMNSSPAVTQGTVEGAAAFVNSLGLMGVSTSADALAATAQAVGEPSVVSRTGGAPTMAIGLAQIMHQFLGGANMMGFWYHFAIMFEALFILTSVDAGTRVARFMLQDTLGNVWPRFKDLDWSFGKWFCTAAMVAGWGSILLLGVHDPLGGINTFFPLFGIANQLLAAMALAVCLAIGAHMGRKRHLWIIAIPLAFAAAVTITGSIYKIFSPVPSIGYWAQHNAFASALAAGKTQLGTAKSVEAMEAVVRNTFVQGSLSILFVVLAVIVIVMAVWRAVQAIRGKSVLNTEDPVVASEVFAPSGFVATPLEKELEKQWQGYFEKHPDIAAAHQAGH